MYRLFIANKNYSSWSLRPWILMRELGIAFEERQVQFEGADNWARFRAFAPNGQVPCLHDGDTVVWDLLGIAMYLAQRHQGVWPADPAARSWAQCAAAEMHSGFSALRNQCGMNCGVRVALKAMPDNLRRDIARLDELWSQGLDRFGGPYLAGTTFSAVDAFFAPVVFRLQTYGLELGTAPAAYAARLLELPAMREWYEAGLAETFRDEAHELELTQFGTVVEDLRRTSI